METITFLRFYRAAYLRRGPRTIENGRLFANSKQNIYVWSLKLQDYRQEHKAIFREYFSTLHEGKIFKLMTFTRGPRTTYCSEKSFLVKISNISHFIISYLSLTTFVLLAPLNDELVRMPGGESEEKRRCIKI